MSMAETSRARVRDQREESEGWIVVVGFCNNIITNPAQNNGDSYYLLCLTHITSIPTSPLRWVLLSSPLYRGQHAGPEKQTDFPKDGHSEMAEPESQSPSAWPHDRVLKGHLRPRERLVTLASG